MKTILRSIILVATIALVLMFYTSKYDVDIETNLQSKISEGVSADVNITDVYKTGEKYNVVFNFERNYSNYEGRAVLEKGRNNKYRFVYADIKGKMSGIQISTSQVDDKRWVEIAGNLNDVIQVVVYPSVQEPFVIEGENLNKKVVVPFNLEEIDYYTVETSKGIKQFGLNHVEEYSTTAEHEINNGDTYIIYAACVLILIIGFIAFSMFSSEVNLLERLYRKVTGVYISKGDPDV